MEGVRTTIREQIALKDTLNQRMKHNYPHIQQTHRKLKYQASLSGRLHSLSQQNGGRTKLLKEYSWVSFQNHPGNVVQAVW